jgi:hypothetical protein
MGAAGDLLGVSIGMLEREVGMRLTLTEELAAWMREWGESDGGEVEMVAE